MMNKEDLIKKYGENSVCFGRTSTIFWQKEILPASIFYVPKDIINVPVEFLSKEEMRIN